MGTTEVITVSSPVTGSCERMQAEARNEAMFCIRALRKRFPGFEFWGTPGNQADTFVIKCEPESNDAKMFAEGFMASAHLWER